MVGVACCATPSRGTCFDPLGVLRKKRAGVYEVPPERSELCGFRILTDADVRDPNGRASVREGQAVVGTVRGRLFFFASVDSSFFVCASPSRYGLALAVGSWRRNHVKRRLCPVRLPPCGHPRAHVYLVE